jgi:hypothetical protein
MRHYQNALIGGTAVVLLAGIGFVALPRLGKAQVQPPPVVSGVAVYGPPASNIVEILCTSNSGLFYPGNSCTSVLPDGRRGGVYQVPANMSLVITSVHMEGSVYRTAILSTSIFLSELRLPTGFSIERTGRLSEAPTSTSTPRVLCSRQVMPQTGMVSSLTTIRSSCAATSLRVNSRSARWAGKRVRARPTLSGLSP